jgi:hypothetical protein
LDEVELQDSAAPFHDWNERITVQCYGPNASSRILDGEQRIISIINNYSKISFNFGPTLLSWMEKHKPEVYEAIIEADRLSAQRYGGHGSAVAQVYNHMIMPLASKRDKLTQARWGIADFRHRFGRDPEGMWLPETAVDTETLEILAELGIKFTILSPRQAKSIRNSSEEGPWDDVTGERIDPTRAYQYKLPSGRDIALFFYDGPISQDLAFGEILSNGETFKERLRAAFTHNGRDWPQLVHIATDGETYGHHHLQGEMALSYCLYLIEQSPELALTNYAQYLAEHPPTMEVQIHENSSWSCVHGVERWRSDCGCNTGMRPSWNQAWRKPLRDSLNWLRDRLAEIYENMGARFFEDPWKARDEYIRVIGDRSPDNIAAFINEHRKTGSETTDKAPALRLLEMQRFAQLMFTSCGWFFDEVSGIENVQVLQYALNAIQLAEEFTGGFIEDDFVRRLKKAPSNLFNDGGEVFEKYVKPAKVDMLRVGAHYAISSLFESYPDEFDFACYKAVSQSFSRSELGRSSIVTGKASIHSKLNFLSTTISFAAIHMGEHNITCGVTVYKDMETHRKMRSDISAPFERGDITDAIRQIDRHFGSSVYSIYHLFKDEQRKVVNEILTPSYQAAENSYRQVYNDNYLVLNFLEWLNAPAPRVILTAAESIVNIDLLRLFSEEKLDMEKLKARISEAKRWSLDLDEETLEFSATLWLNRVMDELAGEPENLELMEDINEALRQLLSLGLTLNLANSQNIYFFLGRGWIEKMQKDNSKDSGFAKDWLDAFARLGALLKVELP